jgi:hypothetical protein
VVVPPIAILIFPSFRKASSFCGKFKKKYICPPSQVLKKTLASGDGGPL